MAARDAPGSFDYAIPVTDLDRRCTITGVRTLVVIMGLLAATGCDRVFGLERADATVPPACPPAPPEMCGLTDPDEDGDAIRNACDPCPQLAGGASSTDTDGDGVGDACDPAPLVASACRSRFFYGFETGDGWIDPAGWSFGGAANSPQTTGLTMLRSNEAHLTGRATVRIEDGIPTGVADSIMGVAILADGAGAYACVINPDTGGATGALALLEIHASAENVRGRSSKFGVTPGLSHDVWLELAADGTLDCRSTDVVSGTTNAKLSIIVPLPVIPASIGVVARHSTSSVEYLDFVPF